MSTKHDVGSFMPSLLWYSRAITFLSSISCVHSICSLPSNVSVSWGGAMHLKQSEVLVVFMTSQHLTISQGPSASTTFPFQSLNNVALLRIFKINADLKHV